ncbi:hypothetical protein OXX79_003105 [Metschnikowia pulcherrima]
MSGSPQRTLQYSDCFRATFRRRMRYVDKICVLLAILSSTVLRAPYGRFWWVFGEAVYRVPVLFVSLWIVKKLRTRNSTVEFSPAKSLAEHVIACTVLSGRFMTAFMSFFASSIVFFSVFLAQLPLFGQYYVLAKEFRVKPAVNDAWVYFWFHATFCAVFYAFQHVSFQRNRLPLQYGVSKVNVESALFANPGFLVGNSAFFTVFTGVFAPLAYIFTRTVIYRANWLVFAALSLDTAVSPFHIGLKNYTNILFASFVLFLGWEFVGHAYNVYATIGCLDGKTALSARSADPVATLLTGLRAVDPKQQIVRTTAFQELAYIASSNDQHSVKTRNAIFNSAPHSAHMWAAILDECSLVIRTTSSRINYRSGADMHALRNTDLILEKDASFSQKEPVIFGNSHDTTSNDTTEFAVSATSSPLRKTGAFADFGISGGKLSKFEKLVAPLWTSLKLYAEQLYGPPTQRQKQSIHEKTTAWRSQVVCAYKQFLASNVGVVFRPTLKRDAESRVQNPALYGNAVLALAGLVMRAVEEDRKNTVTNAHISEVMNLLERPIRSCANYTDVVPASVFVSAAEKGDPRVNQHLVAELHDLTMTEFFELCVKYNYKLNDLSLSSRAFKLAKWVTDASIAQQQKQEKSQMAKYL